MSEVLAPASAAVQTSASTAGGDISSMTVEQLAAGLQSKQLGGFQRDDALRRYASLLKGETPAPRVAIAQMPTAADQSAQGIDHEQAVAPGVTAALADFYLPAKSPNDYTVPISHRATPENRVFDSAVRQSFYAAQVPAVTANAISTAIDHVALSLGRANQTQLQTFATREASGLQQLWGDQFAAKVEAVDAFLDTAAKQIPFLADMLADPRGRYYFADRHVVTALSQMLEGRATKT